MDILALALPACQRRNVRTVGKPRISATAFRFKLLRAGAEMDSALAASSWFTFLLLQQQCQ